MLSLLISQLVMMRSFLTSKKEKKPKLLMLLLDVMMILEVFYSCEMLMYEVNWIINALQNSVG